MEIDANTHQLQVIQLEKNDTSLLLPCGRRLWLLFCLLVAIVMMAVMVMMMLRLG